MPITSTVSRSPIHALELDRRPERFKVYTQRDLGAIPQLQQLPESLRFEMEVVASVLPFRVNEYVLNELIDWTQIPQDPIFQLVFPQRGMLTEEHFDLMAKAHRSGRGKEQIKALSNEI